MRCEITVLSNALSTFKSITRSLVCHSFESHAPAESTRLPSNDTSTLAHLGLVDS